jgi:O-antigen/teichoic acid export membrane protein
MLQESSIKKNFALNLINTLSGLLFPLITFPYASRILMADGIGQVQFFQSIINYVALCTALGIPLYAVREIARVRDNKELCSRTTTEILILHAILTLAGYLVVFILAITIVKIKIDVPLFILLSTSLFFTAIGVPWFYQAIEDFKYITIRSLIIRICSLMALFIFVKSKNDLFHYAAITVIADVGSNLFNFFRLRKHIDLHTFDVRGLNPWKHLKPALKIFVLNLIISIYVNLDSVMLGFLKDEQAVGYYAAATRLTKAFLGIVSSLGMVLLPRFSNLISNDKIEEFSVLANKAVSFVIAISLPMTIGLIFFSTFHYTFILW